MNTRTAVMNAGKMNYDGTMDFYCLSSDTVVYDDTKPEDFIERIQGAACVVTKEYPVSSSLIEQFPESVKLIVEAGTGYNNIDVAAAQRRGITVCNVPSYSSDRVAQTAIMLMLNLSSMMQVQIRMLAKGDHSNFTKHLMVQHTELNGKTLGLVGAGNIGMQVARIARTMGMNVLIYRRHPKEDEEGIRYTNLREVLQKSDYLSLHCPLTEETYHILNETTLGMMKPTAFVINTSRGALIDEPALIAALQEKRIAGAGLDVLECEPPADDHPFYSMEQVILTPHMGWKGYETRQRLLSIIKTDVESFFAGTPVNVVSGPSVTA